MATGNQFLSDGMLRRQEVFYILVAAIFGGLFCLFLFSLSPTLDLDTTRKFYSPDTGFIYQNIPMHEVLRWFVYYGLIAFYVVTVFAGLQAWQTLELKWGLSWDRWLYLFSAMLIGPLLIANVILKGFWGRVRPRDLLEFGGGSDQFTQFWIMTDGCASNCSFVSGEVSGAAMLATSLVIILTGKMRFLAIFLGGVITAIAAWLRVSVGAHFLSDTMMAIVLMTIAACLLYRWFYFSENLWLKKLEAKSPAYIA